MNYKERMIDLLTLRRYTYLLNTLSVSYRTLAAYKLFSESSNIKVDKFCVHIHLKTSYIFSTISLEAFYKTSQDCF